jgi:DNA-binding NtrC family response regulator
MVSEIMARILIIDDDQHVPVALQAALTKAGHNVAIATVAEQGLALAEKQAFDVVLADLHWKVAVTTRLEPKGLEVVAQLRRTKPQLPVILITAIPATETTIEASKLGAYDYITKPTNQKEFEDLLEAVRAAAASRPAEPPPVEEQVAITGTEPIIGTSWAMQTVFKEIGRVAAKPVTVLIRGETGTGKELVARALHEHSERKEQPFVIVNCVAIPDSLLESELFGHEKGAFTGAMTQRVGRFEQADHGTIFLDEIGDMSLHTQAKLLRVLQEKTIERVGGKETFLIDVRVIAATHRDLEKAVEEKAFRRDLYYRLNDAVISLPPLRERTEDIPELVHFFLGRHAIELGAGGSTIAPEALQLLLHHPWPGNVRELRNVVRKALLEAHGLRIDPDIIRNVLDETRIIRPVAAPQLAPDSTAERPLAAYISELLDAAERGESAQIAASVTEWAEREIYGQTIRLAQGDQTKAARWLGISRPTIREKLTRYHLHPALGSVSKDQPL